jgi:hypothetical protein
MPGTAAGLASIWCGSSRRGRGVRQTHTEEQAICRQEQDRPIRTSTTPWVLSVHQTANISHGLSLTPKETSVSD